MLPLRYDLIENRKYPVLHKKVSHWPRHRNDGAAIIRIGSDAFGVYLFDDRVGIIEFCIAGMVVRNDGYCLKIWWNQVFCVALEPSPRTTDIVCTGRFGFSRISLELSIHDGYGGVVGCL